MSASPRTPISFALGLQTLCRAEERAGLPPLGPARHAFEKSPRQSAVQSRRPVVAGRTRLSREGAVPNSARYPLNTHCLVPTWPVASCDRAKMNPQWVSVSEN